MTLRLRQKRDGQPIPTLPFPVLSQSRNSKHDFDIHNGTGSKTAQANVDELSVDIAFPSGLVQFNSAGTRIERTVSLQVQYRETGTGDWTDVPGTKPLSVVGTSISIADYEDGTYSVYVANPSAVISIVLGTDPISG